jgi:hypothetical protein
MTPSPAVQRGKTLLATARLLGRFAQLVQVKRALEAADADPQQHMWRILYGGLSNLAAIEWCKAFGANHSNKLHWKRVYTADENGFRAAMLTAVRLTHAEFTDYWAGIKHWRDTDFAHTDPDAEKLPQWPHFEVGLLAADFYYDRVLTELSNDHGVDMLPRDLAHYRTIFDADVSQAAKLALAATATLPPSRY